MPLICLAFLLIVTLQHNILQIYYKNHGDTTTTTTTPPIVIPLTRGMGDPSVGSLTLANITTHKEANSKRPTKIFEKNHL